MTLFKELNFDGLVGPTHNYAGLAYGNEASSIHGGNCSNPKLAVKQSIAKMRMLVKFGIGQGIIPPHQRPNINLLRQLGFIGKDHEIISKAYKNNPSLVAACYSGSSMWTANMATVSPSSNTADGKVHITPANMVSNLHRAQEADFNYDILQKIFSSEHFVVHKPLPKYYDCNDEGAANHSNLCVEYGEPGLEVYIYGREGITRLNNEPQNYPARQTRIASEAVARLHNVNAMFIKQNPQAIDAGAFHNDVVFVANKNVMFYHQQAFIEDITEKLPGYIHIIVKDSELSLSEAVKTYIFNSQLVSINSNEMYLIVPMECKESVSAQKVLHKIISDSNPISKIYYVECRQSMWNGGGPACLRLRTVLNNDQEKNVLQSVIMNESKLLQIETWAEKHYRDQLSHEDLQDPNLIIESYTALDELTKLLAIGSIYEFQKA